MRLILVISKLLVCFGVLVKFTVCNNEAVASLKQKLEPFSII
jgi:hypothetical protein